MKSIRTKEIFVLIRQLYFQIHEVSLKLGLDCSVFIVLKFICIAANLKV